MPRVPDEEQESEPEPVITLPTFDSIPLVLPIIPVDVSVLQIEFFLKELASRTRCSEANEADDACGNRLRDRFIKGYLKMQYKNGGVTSCDVLSRRQVT